MGNLAYLNPSEPYRSTPLAATTNLGSDIKVGPWRPYCSALNAVRSFSPRSLASVTACSAG